MRGDRPGVFMVFGWWWKFTPHARGSTAAFTASSTAAFVYPACAGIDLRFENATYLMKCLPRMRGDRPTLMVA